MKTTTTTHRILIIDDDPNDTELTKRALSKAGFGTIIEATASGEGALELLRREANVHSLIFLDLKMPGMSGVETLRCIRADECLRRSTVIILSNSLLESDKDASYAAGADDFMQKSIDIDRFERDIKAVLGRWMKE